MDEKMILPEDPEAAKLVTVTFWKSRNGRYYEQTDEAIARSDGCTHRHCKDCGEPTEKRYIHCEKCRARRDKGRWLAMERKPWDGEAPLCIMGTEVYFWGESDLDDYCDENSVKPEDLLLVYCEPAKPRELDVVDFLEECLPEDGGGVPLEVTQAADALNEALKTMKPLVWYQGKVAVDLGK